MLIDLGVTVAKITTNCQLVINKISGKYRCNSFTLSHTIYWPSNEHFDNIVLRHVPRDENEDINQMVQLAPDLKILENILEQSITILWKKNIMIDV